jgi:membrane protein DedA with SNARE-associated domain
MQDWLIMFSAHYPYIIYGLIIVLACAEGPILSMIFGVLIRFGFFSLLPVYIALMVGDLLGDTIWYWIGRRFGHPFIARFGRYFNITEGSVEKVTGIFHKYKHYILIGSKVTNGFGFALVTLVTAGMVKIPFWEYMSANALGQCVWTGLLLSVGYFFSNFYLTVDSILGKMSVVALLVIGFVAFIRYKRYLNTHIERMSL